ncbi:hypothetical protein A2130_03235 [Candidatus Woesebacteria bacterium GWC2_33_12]|uniref:Uncharacterized protein n=1 Tax=Candidatus Woesebacteria bacterium GW2011_GWB1_33_22 TaxID=1618566 RepID=A0A0F9ZKF8_9BACT|nr:MAG: hypothetical protein UR29_C0004G0012 [Candidatus Woesebacteria bacterium GW2011_GWC2_33_12]KKP41974.1 MAG: hypothetical protein UR33_C0007G0037 [Candidatus Woesebacteria bacterium GW2011_GWA2_33_20]KKP44589.1 MAG: hypothetical protein UR35_C0007G0005 [Candidatus Woesebacteria bacterium GW2011_GWB1_33_22]KKP46393.1 MAG: hypothetical protein UR37_C0008G0005 [Microgenomates group bacterium GW2011_GWC1_33_28]KKP50447.1 MAG: hypothetical protein UR41_C0007G0005 [Candidatus Woesebacteria bact
MEKYGRVLIVIFFLCLINLGLSVFAISKPTPVKLIVNSSPTPLPTSISKNEIATNSGDLKSDLTLIKAEIRALREILGTTGSFEELSTLIKTLNNNE